jgi:exonuclease III
MTIAFWNINNNTDLADLLIDFVQENDIDILLLAETHRNLKGNRKCEVDDVLNDFIIKSKKMTRTFTIIPNADFRVKVISSLSDRLFRLKNHLFSSSRWSAFNIEIPGIMELNLFPVHFYSKVNWSEFSLALECVNFSRDIAIVEKDTNCTNSILIGDFNMSPFEYGIVASNGIHALQDINYLSSVTNGREIDGTFYKYFYNPMWNFFGDYIEPYGTIYHRVSGHISHEWHMYDQIILRPELKQHMNENSIKIITEIAGQTVLKNYSRPDEKFSDHLPIKLTLRI